jgi:hypothetical protein
MALPGKVAMQLRLQFKDMIVSYLNGDRSVYADIKAKRKMGKLKSYSRFVSKP